MITRCAKLLVHIEITCYTFQKVPKAAHQAGVFPVLGNFNRSHKDVRYVFRVEYSKQGRRVQGTSTIPNGNPIPVVHFPIFRCDFFPEIGASTRPENFAGIKLFKK
jgi:hypothetical protein